MTVTTKDNDATATTADVELGMLIPTPTAKATPIKPVVTMNHTTIHRASASSGPPESNGQADCALICAIAGLFVFGIILGPIAICMGMSAKKEIQANPRMTGDCHAQSAIIIGAIDVICSIIGIIMIFGSGGDVGNYY